MFESAASSRRSYQPTARWVPSGVTWIDGCHWSVVVASPLTRCGADQVVPPLVDCVKKMSDLSVPAPWSLYTQYRLPVIGLATICGKALERKPVGEPGALRSRPRSPLTDALTMVATVIGAPKVAPWSVEMMIR